MGKLPRRLTQHRAKRDRAVARELTDLKRENGHLRRKVSKLEGQINKISGSLLEPDDAVWDEHFSKPLPGSAGGCKECKVGKLQEFKTPSGKVVVSCLACKARQ